MTETLPYLMDGRGREGNPAVVETGSPRWKQPKNINSLTALTVYSASTVEACGASTLRPSWLG